MASLRWAVNLASEPGKPHLALAQLLHRIGEYRAAIELYQRLDAEHTQDSFIHQHRAAIAHNLAQAQQALAFELAER